MTEELTLCPVCDSSSLTVGTVERTEKRRDGNALSYSAPATVCDRCELSFTTPAQSRNADIARGIALRERRGSLNPSEILELRQELGLTRGALETLLGVGQRTLIRWESGSVVQSGSADMLMRVLRAVPAARGFCASYAGVPLPVEYSSPESADNLRFDWTLGPVFSTRLAPVESFWKTGSGMNFAAGMLVRQTGPPDALLAAPTDAISDDAWIMAHSGVFRIPRSQQREQA